MCLQLQLSFCQSGNKAGAGPGCLAVDREGASAMAHWTKVLAAKPDDLSSVPGTHMEKGKNPLPKTVLNLPMCTVTYAHTCTH